MSRAFVFPGQGSQAVGMGVDLAGAFQTARDVFQEVDEALKQNSQPTGRGANECAGTSSNQFGPRASNTIPSKLILLKAR